MKRLILLLFLPGMALGGPIDDLAAMMQGRFDTHPPGVTVDIDVSERLVDSRQRVDAPDLGDVVFYLQLNQGEDLKLYRQRILVFRIEGGVTVQRAYVLQDPERFVDARRSRHPRQGRRPCRSMLRS